MVPGRHAAECVYATERAGASGAKQDDAAAAARKSNDMRMAVRWSVEWWGERRRG
jgi:hypothetical protein